MSTPAEAVIDNPSPPPVMDGTAAETPEAAPAEPAAPKHFVDEARNAIYAKFAANRGKVDSSGAAMAQAVAQIGPDGEPVQSSTETPAAPLAQAGDVRTITVDGQPRQVTSADIERAGIQTLQKEVAADLRLQRAGTIERELASRLQNLPAEVERKAAEIAQAAVDRMISEGRLPKGGAPSAATGKASLPSGGKSGAGSKAATKQALEALLDSDTDRAAETLERVIAERADHIVSEKLAAAGNAGTARATAPATPGGRAETEIAAANEVFADVFPDVLHNPQALAVASARMQAEMANPVNQGVSLHRIALQIGRDIRVQMQPAARVNPGSGSGSADELAARRSLAARVPAVPSSGAGRTVDQPPQQTVAPSRKEVVQQMRRARGLPT